MIWKNEHLANDLLETINNEYIVVCQKFEDFDQFAKLVYGILRKNLAIELMKQQLEC